MKKKLVIGIIAIVVVVTGLIAWAWSRPPKVQDITFTFVEYQWMSPQHFWNQHFMVSNNSQYTIAIIGNCVGTNSPFTIPSTFGGQLLQPGMSSPIERASRDVIPQKLGVLVSLDDSLLSRLRLAYYSFQTNRGHVSSRPYTTIWCDKLVAEPATNPTASIQGK